MLERLKIRLNISSGTYDDLINGYIDIVSNKLKLKYGWTNVPEIYEYIVEDYVYCIMRTKKALGLQFDDTTRDDDILDALMDVDQEFLNFMNRDYMPENLTKEITAGMVYCVNTGKRLNISGISHTSGPVKSIKEGDTTIQFESSGSGDLMAKNTVADLFNDSLTNLYKLRRFNW